MPRDNEQSLKHLLPRNGFAFGGCAALALSGADMRAVTAAMKEATATRTRLAYWLVEKCLAELFAKAHDCAKYIPAIGMYRFWRDVASQVAWSRSLRVEIVRAVADYLLEGRLRGQDQGGFAADVEMGRTVRAIDDFVAEMRARNLGHALPNIIPEDSDEEDDASGPATGTITDPVVNDLAGLLSTMAVKRKLFTPAATTNTTTPPLTATTATPLASTAAAAAPTYRHRIAAPAVKYQKSLRPDADDDVTMEDQDSAVERVGIAAKDEDEDEYPVAAPVTAGRKILPARAPKRPETEMEEE